MLAGLLLFAHGARDPNWAAPFEAVLAQARAAGAQQQPPPQVRLAFLEFMQPDLIEAGSSLVLAGCEQIDVVPLFLGAGGHVRKDLPRLLDQLRASYPQVRWTLRPAVGESPEVVAAMAAAAVHWLSDENAACSSEPDQPTADRAHR